MELYIPQTALDYANNYSKFYNGRIMSNLRLTQCHPTKLRYRVLASIYAWPSLDIISEAEYIPGVYEVYDGKLYLVNY